jgi:predicted deacylase
MEKVLSQVEGITDLMLDKLVAMGIVNLGHFEAVGVEPLVAELELPEELANRVVATAIEAAKRIEAETLAAKELAAAEAAQREAQAAAEAAAHAEALTAEIGASADTAGEQAPTDAESTERFLAEALTAGAIDEEGSSNEAAAAESESASGSPAPDEGESESS